MTAPSGAPVYAIGGGAGFAGDRTDAAVRLAASGQVNAVGLECLAERTLIAALTARAADPQAGADPRLKRRLSPLLPYVQKNGCRIISNLGAANPSAAARKVAALARELDLGPLRIAAIEGDDVMRQLDQVRWQEQPAGRLIGAHAYIGAEMIAQAMDEGADIVITGRAADSALFAGPLLPHLDQRPEAVAMALTVGHLLECSGQVTGGNYERPGGGGLDAPALAQLGFPIAHVRRDGTADITVLDDDPGIVDRLTCTLQLLYEVHDPSRYITPDGVIDFTTTRIEEIGPRRVRVSGTGFRPAPQDLKVVGFAEEPGMIADVEMGLAGFGAHERALRAADVLRHRLSDWPQDDLRIDIVGIDSILGGASRPANATTNELRVHVSARCPDAEAAQIIEDEVYALTLSGPGGGGSLRSEKRRNIATVTGFIDRDAVPLSISWGTSR
ncbi:acyclic terpene utilization AtuA family protein [Rhodoligotrophos defluvii]|uniref:acyclic terpene utilization AtuA family protein n=1 Tax=Rhodoligotrophos defluvii TaxID=2561934 RepID=UPI0010C9C231|nr:acyclic terpene utilization AtuA family protein [Rhodoligotrophos defluvii]